MARIIALAQQKGGVGKTTLTICLASEIRRCRYSVAVVDTDPQHSACEWAAPGKLGFPVQAMPFADHSFTSWAREISRFDADYVLLDTAPDDKALRAAASLSQMVLLPCTPSGLDLDATVRSLRIVNAVRQRRRDSLLAILVPNRVDPRTLEGRQLIDELKQLGEIVGPAVGDRSIFVRTFATGRSVCDQAPGSSADREVRALWVVAERMLNAPTALRPRLSVQA
jgi:chromosome partitioning protein